MQEISKKVLESYQVRKTKKQKTEFIEFLQNELDVDIQIEEGGLLKSRNLIVGDLEKAEYVLSAHYDTQPVLPFPNFLTPKNLLIYILFNIVIIIPLFVLSIGAEVFVISLTHSSLLGMIANWIVIISFLWILMGGVANKHTANDNTSGVITLLEVIQNPELKDKVACVFFDHEEVGLFGSMFFNKKHKEEMKNKLLINFDCVGDGDTIMIILNKSIHNQYKDKFEESFKVNNNKEVLVTTSSSTIYPSDQLNFKRNVAVAAFKKNKWVGYYLDKIHTSKDVNCDERNIVLIIEGLKKLVIE